MNIKIACFTLIAMIAQNIIAEIYIYQKDALSYLSLAREKVRLENREGFRLTKSPEPVLSDHELMVANVYGTTALSYNIASQFERKQWVSPDGKKAGTYFNNGFMAETETNDSYKLRISRIITRIANAVTTTNAKIICLQETPSTHSNSDVELGWFIELIKTHLPQFTIDHQGQNMMLIANDRASHPIDFSTIAKLFHESKQELPIARYVPQENLVIINQHAKWTQKSQEDSHNPGPVISIYNQMLQILAASQPGARLAILGDFNREDCEVELGDQGRTVDIRMFAKKLEHLTNIKTFTSGHYTNLRNNNNIGMILTASDYLVTGDLPTQQ